MKTRVGTGCNVASPAAILSTSVLPVLLLYSALIISITVCQIASEADVAERIFAKGARKGDGLGR